MVSRHASVVIWYRDPHQITVSSALNGYSDWPDLAQVFQFRKVKPCSLDALL
jgi:hypothetical protein